MNANEPKKVSLLATSREVVERGIKHAASHVCREVAIYYVRSTIRWYGRSTYGSYRLLVRSSSRTKAERDDVIKMILTKPKT